MPMLDWPRHAIWFQGYNKHKIYYLFLPSYSSLIFMYHFIINNYSHILNTYHVSDTVLVFTYIIIFKFYNISVLPIRTEAKNDYVQFYYYNWNIVIGHQYPQQLVTGIHSNPSLFYFYLSHLKTVCSLKTRLYYIIFT